jgi:hypothetical protein
MPERYETEGAVKKFSKLKDIHLHDLPSLQEICAARMYAPMLESVYLRGCWSLSRSRPWTAHCPLREGLLGEAEVGGT